MFSFKCDANGKYDLDSFMQEVGLENFKEYFYSHSNELVQKEFGITSWTLTNIVKKYNLHRTTEQQNKNRNALIDLKYGGRDECVRRCKETKKVRYGDENYTNPEKRHETLMSRYSVDNISQVPGAQDRKRLTCLNKYGTDVSSKCTQVKEKSKQTRIKHYGSVENSYKVGLESLTKILKQKYDVDWYVLKPECRQVNYHTKNSKYNLEFEELLNQFGLEYETEFNLENKFYDFQVGKYLIEIDPYATHNSTWTISRVASGIASDYHRNKTLLALKYGYMCIHLFDWMDKLDILNKIRDNILTIRDTNNIKLYLYDIKKNCLTTREATEPKYLVEIYDDGFELEEIVQ